MENSVKHAVACGKTALGIEFGSTRIKAVLVDEANNVIASGSHEWENRHIGNIWSYSLEDIRIGVQDAYAEMARDVKEKYGETLTVIGAIGFSAMMHGGVCGRKPHRTLRLPHPRTLVDRTSLSGDPRRRGTCAEDQIPNDARRVYPLEIDGEKSARDRRGVWDVPRRPHHKAV